MGKTGDHYHIVKLVWGNHLWWKYAEIKQVLDTFQYKSTLTKWTNTYLSICAPEEHYVRSKQYSIFHGVCQDVMFYYQICNVDAFFQVSECNWAFVGVNSIKTPNLLF